MASRRDEALELAQELVTDIELERVAPMSILLKAIRLATLVDDKWAIFWLGQERNGFNAPDEFHAKEAAEHTGRLRDPGDHWDDVNSKTLTELIYLSTEAWEDETQRRAARLVQGVMGAVHAFAVATYVKLRFGSVIESAFERVRETVDAKVAALVPGAADMFASAFENVESDNPEDWANAAATCRRLLKEVADALQPPGPDVDGRKMGNDHYTNRLIAWIQTHQPSETLGDLATSDLEHFGNRLDAADSAGHKGAHSTVTQDDAARFITGTYLLIGDILALAPGAVDSAVERVLGDASTHVDVQAVVNTVKYDVNVKTESE